MTGERASKRKLLDFDDELNLERYDKVREFRRKPRGRFETDVIWSSVFAAIVLHVIAVYTFLTFPYVQKWRTVLFFFALVIASTVGVMVFAHRYCSHKAFKANLPLKLIMMLLYSCSGSYSAYTWTINHRVHHKYTDTMADPYNARRGFFFAHIGWFMLKLTPEYHRRATQIDMSDFENDKLLMFYERNYRLFYFLFTFLVPTLVTTYFWQETFYHSVSFNLARYIVGQNFVWCINSVSHFFGDKPYDSNCTASENLFVAIVACGEGWHNYHHKFPWDYRAGEPGKINLAANFIDLFSTIGWAYDLRVASPNLIRMVLDKQTARNDAALRASTEYDYHI